ncbi:MAG: phosphomannomutase [Pseudorhodobacter sp.]|nr:phosphomannomutase [Pseudorhodobacter sp.]
MPPKFGTSGLRGLVVDLTPDLVAAHLRAFARACPMGTGLFVARDLRPSSRALSAGVMAAARAAGLAVTDCGAIPTPALALAASAAGAAAVMVMVTGSHIPANRNGLKFYTPAGEITKPQEAAILAALATPASPAAPGPAVVRNGTAGAAYGARYVTAYGAAALAGLRLGVWSHSAVGRDILITVLAALGADVVELGRSARFTPLDTEALAPATVAQLRLWAARGNLDAIASIDGDGDRPLLSDAAGQVIAGDVLGQITATALGAEVVATPLSSNTGVEAGGRFGRVIRTRIGSPYVLAAMQATPGRVVGYEANGGFVLGFAATGPTGPLPALLTRDALLPLIATLVQARGRGGLAALVAAEPARFTAAGRLRDVPTKRAQALVAAFAADAAARADFLATLGEAEASADHADGLRLTLKSGRFVHLRPSGNAPELRFYTEAETPQAAAALLAAGLGGLARALA